jgi:CheY-like chemotaxis protein
MPKQILLVDDSVTIHRVVELTFAREDYTVTSVKSGDEGLAKAREIKPDIVLADAGMLGKSGYDVCAGLRADAQLASVPCLILTGNFAPYDDVKGQKSGADGFVVKPFETQAIIDKVADAIAKRARGNGAASVEPATSNKATAPTLIAAAPSIAPVPSAPAPRPPAAVEDLAAARPAPANRPTTLPPPPVTPAPRPATPTARTMMGIPAPSIPAPPVIPAAPPAPKPAPRGAQPAPPAPPAPPAIEERTPLVVESLGKPLSLVGDEDITSQKPKEAMRPEPAPAPSPAPSIERPRAAMPSSVPQMPRPSMIPHTPTPQPAAARPAASATPAATPQPPAAPQVVPAPRMTLMGMPVPAVGPTNLPPGAVPLPPSIKPAPAPAPAPAPPAPTDTASRLGGAWAPPPPPPPPAAAPSLVSAVTERAVSEITARGAEHEAIAKLSREVIERIAWEVVPELAETIIREQLDRLVAERQK